MKYFLVLCLLAAIVAVTVRANPLSKDTVKQTGDAEKGNASLPLKRVERAPRGGGVINGAQTQVGGGGVINGAQTQVGGGRSGGVINGAQTQIGRTRG